MILSYKQHPEYPVIIIHNRDEYYERATEPAQFWEEYPDILAGRDARCGGTWLGVTRNGRFGAVTNYRDPASQLEHAQSRGLMMLDFLNSNVKTEAFLDPVFTNKHQFSGFNLLLGDMDSLYYYSNMGPRPRELSPGTYGLTNHLLNTPWPKVTRSMSLFENVTSSGKSFHVDDLMAILADSRMAEDSELPDTGVGLELERILSSIFITSEIYGTRSSTVILFHKTGQVQFVEKSFDSDTDDGSTVMFEFDLEQ